MKITYVIPSLGKGGAEDVILTLANGLCQNNDVRVLILRNVADDQYNISRLSEDVEIRYLYDPSVPCGSAEESMFHSFGIIRRGVIAYFKGREYARDVIHLNLTMGSVLGTIWKTISVLLRHKPKYLETFHTNLHLLPISRKIIFSIGWNLRDRLVYEIHEDEKSKILKYLINKTKLSYIPFSAQTHLDSTHDVDRKDVCLKHEPFVILTVSRMRLFEKKIAEMVEALDILRDRYNRKVRLVLAGDGKDLSAIKEMVAARGLSDYVEFMGYVDKPELVMLSADIYLCAMVGDDPGISGLQAGQLGIPVVGVQTLRGFQSKPIISCDNSSELAGVIESFISDTNYKVDYSQTVKNHIDDKFSVEQMIRSYESLYRQI